MRVDLSNFLADRSALCVEEAQMWNGEIRMRLSTFADEAQPPDDLVTSVKAIIFSGTNVLVSRNPAGVHILPGGRREAGESQDQALHREIFEETGLEIDIDGTLGILVYHHLTPMPEGYSYPYPDFINVVYMASAHEEREVVVKDEYELEAAFMPTSETVLLRLPQHQRILLSVALNRREMPMRG